MNSESVLKVAKLYFPVICIDNFTDLFLLKVDQIVSALTPNTQVFLTFLLHQQS